jgi:Cd2+/Zn2+-exporting ATPase
VTDAQELSGRGVQVKVDGRTVCAGNGKLMQEQGVSFTPAQEVGTVVYVAREGTYLGCVVIADQVKPDAAQAIARLKSQGVRRTVMLTGDAQTVAQAVGKQLGLDEVHAQLLPADKVEQVERLLGETSSNGSLVFVGDGINDAPVLSRADVGVAMGALGSDAAIEAADVVLMDDKPSKLAAAVTIARRTLGIVKQNIVFALAVKALVLILIAVGVATMWMAVFADVGVAVLAILNAMRALNLKSES